MTATGAQIARWHNEEYAPCSRMIRRLVALLAACLLPPLLRAHTVPTITVEAEFSAGRDVVLRVNLDPRLFLSDQPTSLPPVPAAWWFDQSEDERARSLAAAAAYVAKTIRFQIGESPLESRWKVVAIDSASAFPLGAGSAEAHLLAEHRAPLPDAAGDFKVTLDERAAVGLILLNSTEGRPERHPQVIFPGETSRGFKLPERTVAAAPAADRQPAPTGRFEEFAQFCRIGSRHFAGDHLLVALALAVVLGGRIVPGAALIASFQASHILAAFAVAGGWLPEAPLWLQAAGWIAIAAGLLLVHRRQLLRAAVCFLVAGLCHGLNTPHLHLAPTDNAMILRDAGWISAAQFSVLALARLVVAVASRRRRGGKAGMQAC